MRKLKICVFVSGNGSNFQNICEAFNNSEISVISLYTNNPNSPAIEVAKKHKIKIHVFEKKELQNGTIIPILNQESPDLIILAGFLLRIPSDLVQAFPRKIINLHPSLLPQYGGKGMYGENVFKAVLANNEQKTGITYHYVNENYDEGAIIEQFSLEIDKNETVNSLKQKTSRLEHLTFPIIIQQILNEVNEC